MIRVASFNGEESDITREILNNFSKDITNDRVYIASLEKNQIPFDMEENKNRISIDSSRSGLELSSVKKLIEGSLGNNGWSLKELTLNDLVLSNISDKEASAQDAADAAQNAADNVAPQITGVSKEEVNYRESDGYRMCKNCGYFKDKDPINEFHQPGYSHLCIKVEGKICSEDVCDIWESIEDVWNSNSDREYGFYMPIK